MKNRNHLWSASLAGLLALVLALGTAAAQGTSKGATSVTSLAAVQTNLRVLSDKLASTMTALEALKLAAKEKATDLKPKFDGYAAAYTALNEQSKLVRAQCLSAKAHAKDHYDSWQSELNTVQSTKLRGKAQDRLATSKKEFDKIILTGDKVKTSFAPVTAEFEDIHTFLKVDLTREAVDDLSGTIWSLGGKVKSVQGDIEDMVKQIDRTLAVTPKN